MKSDSLWEKLFTDRDLLIELSDNLEAIKDVNILKSYIHKIFEKEFIVD